MSEFTEAEYLELSELLRTTSGISLGGDKRALVQARLSGRLRQTHDPDIGTYLRRVRADASGRELGTLIDLLSTNVTAFFREPHHFEHLKNEFLPARQATGDPGTIRVWSAACSSGEEPYSIAMTLADALGELKVRRFLILATDISSRMVAQASAGEYAENQLTTLSPEQRSSWLSRVPSGQFQIKHILKERVRVRRLNLLDSWPMKKPFDVIFCRNALIYFEQDLQERIVQRYFRQLRPGGFLYIGHSESLANLNHQFEYVRPTIYRRPQR